MKKTLFLILVGSLVLTNVNALDCSSYAKQREKLAQKLGKRARSHYDKVEKTIEVGKSKVENLKSKSVQNGILGYAIMPFTDKEKEIFDEISKLYAEEAICFSR